MSNPIEDKYAPTSWAQSIYQDVVCPSGQTCLVKKIGMEDLISLGLTSEVDVLTGISGKKIEEGKERLQGHKSKKLTKAEQAKADAAEEKKLRDSFIDDPAKMETFVNTISRVLISCVVKPELHETPADAADRDNSLIYVDQVEFNDKMAIFTFVMSGVSKIEPFRSESGEDVGPLESVEIVQLPS